MRKTIDLNNREGLKAAVLLIVITIVCGLIAFACTTKNNENVVGHAYGNVHTFEAKLPDGRNVTCVQTGEEGLSCDWIGAAR